MQTQIFVDVIELVSNVMLVLVNRLEEGGVLTDCNIQTQEPDETLDFDFTSSNVMNKIIMKVNGYFLLETCL